jgi:hypothetical protein
MNLEYQYILQPYKGMSSRYNCPSCNKKNQFARYINTQTNEHLADHVGRCNREVNCGYHYTPKQFFEDNPELASKDKNASGFTYKKPMIKQLSKPEQDKKISTIAFNVFEKTLKAYENNNLVKFLINRIGEKETEKVIEKYYLGTSKHWEGSTIFWQIDIEGNIRTGKVMLYNSESGKRIKEPYPHINWIHKIADYKEYNLSQCLFGEHLLKLYPEKDIAIVESEKTALIASVHIPEYNWLASGNINNLNQRTLQNLKEKSIFLFPDAGAFEIWKEKAEKLKEFFDFKISDLIETRATPEQIKKGYDLADYLTEKPKKFTAPDESEHFEEEPSNNNIPEDFSNLRPEEYTPDYNYLEDEEIVKTEDSIELWNIEELETFFKHIKLPEEPIQLDKATKINDVKKFIENNLKSIKHHNGKRVYKPYYDRLITLKNLLEKPL